MKIIKNEEINENLFSQMIRLDHEVWPSDDENYLPTSYLHRLYENSKDGLFFAVDDEDKLIGYQTLIFVDEDNFQKYYETGDFTVLKNISSLSTGYFLSSLTWSPITVESTFGCGFVMR